jgi:NitT/TauT family transport system substrate-binding protein
MKLTPFAKAFLTIVIVALIALTLYIYRGKLRGVANKGKEKPVPTQKDPTKPTPQEPSDKDLFNGVNSTVADPPRTGVTGVAETTVGSDKLGRPLIVAINTWAGHSPGIVANGGLNTAKGSIYDKLGVQIEFKIFDDPVAKFAAFQAGQIDVMWDTVDSWAREASVLGMNKTPAKSIIMQDWSRGGDGIVSKATITSIEDLKGKSVSVIEFSPSHWFILYLLSQSGLTNDEKKTVSLKYFAEPAQVKAAFTSGSVDAMVSWEPFLSEAIANGGDDVHMLVSTAAATNVIADTLVARQEVIDKGPASMQAFVLGWFQGIDAMKTDPAAAYALIANALKLTPDDVSGMLSGLKLTPFADNAQFYGLTGVKSHYETLFNSAYQVYRRLGKTSASVDAKDWADTRFVAALAPMYPGQKVVEADVVKPSTKKASPKDHGIINKQLSINFVPGSADLMAGSEFTLDALGEMMVSFGNTYLQVEGNTDTTGKRDVNIELSKKRAETVQNYLVKNFQLSPDRFKTLGLGPDNPVATNKTEAGRQQNRRTDIKVMLGATK